MDLTESPLPEFIPPVFVSHGAPTLMLAPGRTGRAWTALAHTFPRPRAILAVSAHWTTRQASVSATAQPETIHDFAGFPEALFRLNYPAPGSMTLARRIGELVPGAVIDSQRGLDHGAWVPLSFLYPAADIPVIQLSVMPHASAGAHIALGRQLEPLTHEGVLILASGGLTHNLHDVIWAAADDEALPYADEFREWLVAALMRGDHAALADYRAQAPHAARAHPSPEHLLPLFVALGAAGENAVGHVIHQGYTLASLAMDALVFGPAPPLYS